MSKEQIAEIDEKISQLKGQIDDLEHQKLEAENAALGTIIQRDLASTLHGMFCHRCLRGSCPWNTEKFVTERKHTFIWSMGEHRMWLNRALRIENELGTEKLKYKNNIDMMRDMLRILEKEV